MVRHHFRQFINAPGFIFIHHAGRRDKINTIRLAFDAFIYPVKFNFQLLRAITRSTKYAHPTSFRHFNNDITAMGKGNERKLYVKQIANG